MKIDINPDWTFKEVVDNIKTIKILYKGVLSSFSHFELKKEIDFKQQTRDSVYALKMQDWKKGIIWDYMNDYQRYAILLQVAGREPKKWKKN